MEGTNNFVELCGTVAGRPMFSHKSRNEDYYIFPLETERLSGAVDRLNVIVRHSMLCALEIEEKQRLAITGELRSFNNRSGQGNRLVMDDANIPSLISMPYIGYMDVEDPLYQQTRKLLIHLVRILLTHRQVISRLIFSLFCLAHTLNIQLQVALETGDFADHIHIVQNIKLIDSTGTWIPDFRVNGARSIL